MRSRGASTCRRGARTRGSARGNTFSVRRAVLGAVSHVLGLFMSLWLPGCASQVSWSQGPTCGDNGPWRCSHNGCASSTVSCFDLRYACTSLLVDLVDPTPSVARTDTVLSHCPATCDPRCSSAQAPVAEVDFVVRFAKSRGARAACPYWHNVGCLTSSVAKMCDGHVDWTTLLQADGVWSCCCPRPGPCAARVRNPTCLESLGVHIGPLLLDLPVLRFPPIAAILAARADLYVAGGHLCRQVLAGVVAEEGDRGIAEAPVACGDELQLNRTIARQELHCEHLVWAWEALGVGQSDEFERSGCPFNPSNRGRRETPVPKPEL